MLGIHPSPHPGPRTSALQGAQSGGSLLSVVAAAGVAMVLMQGTMFYKSREAAKFLDKEKAKVLASQLSEAGVEETIADIGQRKLKVTEEMENYPVYEGQGFGGGSFSTYLTTVARGADADTVDLVADGQVGGGSDRIHARLRLRNQMDSTETVIMTTVPVVTTVTTTEVVTVHDTTITTQDPDAMLPVEEQSAYLACMASSAKKCDVCHIPLGNPDNRHVITINKSAIKTHFDHHGDYVTTDGTCDVYNPVTTITPREETVTHTEEVITNEEEFTSTWVVDTLVKVQVLSWR